MTIMVAYQLTIELLPLTKEFLKSLALLVVFCEGSLAIAIGNGAGAGLRVLGHWKVGKVGNDEGLLLGIVSQVVSSKLDRT